MDLEPCQSPAMTNGNVGCTAAPHQAPYDANSSPLCELSPFWTVLVTRSLGGVASEGIAQFLRRLPLIRLCLRILVRSEDAQAITFRPSQLPIEPKNANATGYHHHL